MSFLPTQETGLYFLLSIIVGIVAVLLAVLLYKDKVLDKLREEFNHKALQLNKKLYETSVLKSKLEAMVNSMTEGVFMLDKDLSLLVINPACRSLLELDMSGNVTIFDIVRAFDKHYPIEETIAEVFKEGQIKQVSDVSIGSKFCQITVIPIEVAEGVPGVGVLLHDQTEEQRLTRKHEEFLAMVVHELRSPLTVIKGMAEILLEEESKIGPEKRNEILHQVENSSLKLLEIVNAILEDTKMDLNKFKINLGLHDINELLATEIKNYSVIAEERKVKLNLIIDKTIPKFNFDNDRVLQIMNNLLSNAIKFTHDGSVTVKSEQDNSMVKILVEDTGDGIPDDKKPLLFQKFVQLENSKKSDSPSTGLGLVIVKAIVEAHGGKIWIEDNKPTGARFVFTLPIK